MPFEDIADSVSMKFNSLLTNATYRVTDATIYFMTKYYNDGIYTVTPIWIFSTTEESSEGKAEVFTFIDAVTGMEIPMEDKY